VRAGPATRGHRAEDCPKKKTDPDPIGEGVQQDHDWEEDSFGDEEYWTVGSMQAVPQSPPGLHPRGGCYPTRVFAPRGEDNGRVALEAETLSAPENKDKYDCEASGNKDKYDCDLFPNSTTGPTRARRMRKDVSQQDDPSEAMMPTWVENAEDTLNGISGPADNATSALKGFSAPQVTVRRSRGPTTSPRDPS